MCWRGGEAIGGEVSSSPFRISDKADNSAEIVYYLIEALLFPSLSQVRAARFPYQFFAIYQYDTISADPHPVSCSQLLVARYALVLARRSD